MSQTDSQEDLEQNSPTSEENLDISSQGSADQAEECESDIVEDYSEEEEEKVSTSFTRLKESLDKLEGADEKLTIVIDFMESTLSQKGTPQFKGFWEARGLCLELFKSQLPPALRALMWEKYSDLSKEARSLKEIFDEKSAYAMEQIGEAISGIEAELDQTDEKLKGVPEIKLPGNPKSLEQNRKMYLQSQRELNLYNAFATRVTALRKELIKTDMRIRFKNQFFSRLSALGDRIFPRRKELIQQVSKNFVADVQAFANSSFSGNALNAPHFVVRDEIKALQASSKVLTLNSGGFNSSRKILSDCWEKLKDLDKEFKKDRAEKREEYEKNAEPILKEIQQLRESLEGKSLAPSEAQQRVHQLSRAIRDTELGREEVKLLQAEIGAVKNQLRELEQVEEKKRKEQKAGQERKILEMIETVRKKISNLEERSDVEDSEVLEEKWNEIEAMLLSPEFPKREASELREELIPLQDLISTKNEERALAFSDDDPEALGKLRQVLAIRQERGEEIRNQIEELRKLLGGSGLDFEQSLRYNELLNRHKDRLNQLNESIEELKSRIASRKK